jgi:dsRNA-specific ribonuclease
MTQQELKRSKRRSAIASPIGCFCSKPLSENPILSENGGQNNEVLEFLGDEVLGYVVTKKMPTWYGHINEDKEFESRLNEAELTEIRKKLVCKAILSKRADILELGQYLIMGKGDIKNHAELDASVKEDTFEAILGAVAIDSNYNEKALEGVALGMLDPEFYLNEGFDADENSVSQLQEWFQRKGYGIPSYQFRGGILSASGWDQECSLVIPGLNQIFRSRSLARPRQGWLWRMRCWIILMRTDFWRIPTISSRTPAKKMPSVS